MAAIEVVRAELDGVPMHAVENGPVVPIVGLTFRVGRADETAATNGVTHLIEHLALPARTDEAVDFNGTVESLVTTFYATGPEDDLRAFVESTLALLRQLPLDRLETERRILRAEEAGRASGGARLALALRYGPVGVGLIGYEEYGLRRLTTDDVERWVAARFTRENLALWVAGTSLEGLVLDVAAGSGRPPAPEPRQIEELRTPSAYAVGSETGICLSFIAPRTVATRLAVDALGDDLRDRVRYELGLSYSIEVDLHPVSPTSTHAVVTADVADDDVPEWLAEAVRLVDALADEGPREARLERLKESIRRWERDPASGSSWAAWSAEWEVIGNPAQSYEDHVAEREAVTRELVARTMQEMKSSLLVLGPEATPLPEGFEEYPLTSVDRVQGRRHRPRGRRDRMRRDLREVALTSGDEGVTIVNPWGTGLTARYASTVLCIREVGARTLLTDDGFFVTVEAAYWIDGDAVLDEIDAAMSPDLVVRTDGELGERIEEVRALARSTFKRTWLVSEELEALPALLQEGEQLLSLAAASRGWRYGLLVVTDGNVRFLYGDGTKHSFTEVRERVRVRSSGRSKLTLDVGGERVELTEIGPKGKAAELAALLGDGS